MQIKILSLWIALFLFFKAPLAFSKNCFEELTLLRTTLSEADIEVNRDKLRFIERGLPYFYFGGSFDPADRTLYLDARLRVASLDMRSVLKGKYLYDKVMQHIGIDRIRFVQGIWADGDNLKAFRANIAKGLTPEESALATWSGRQASRYGFDRVAEVFYATGDDRVNPYVFVLFERSFK